MNGTPSPIPRKAAPFLVLASLLVAGVALTPTTEAAGACVGVATICEGITCLRGDVIDIYIPFIGVTYPTRLYSITATGECGGGTTHCTIYYYDSGHFHDQVCSTTPATQTGVGSCTIESRGNIVSDLWYWACYTMGAPLPLGVKLCTDTLLEGPFDPNDCTEAGQGAQGSPQCDSEPGIFVAQWSYQYRVDNYLDPAWEDGACTNLYVPPLQDGP